MMWRVTLVFGWRTEALQTNIDDYLAPPGFNTMLWMVWVWRLEGFPRRDRLEGE